MHARLLQSCLTLCNSMECRPPGSSVHGIFHFPTGVGCHALLQGIFPTQGSNPPLLCLLHWQVVSLPLVPPGKPPHIRHSSNNGHLRTRARASSPQQRDGNFLGSLLQRGHGNSKHWWVSVQGALSRSYSRETVCCK